MQLFTVQIKSENTLVVVVPSQPEMEVVPYKGTEFTIKGTPNAAVELILDASGVAVEARLRQAGAVLTAPKKK
jgi:hypothetical protein